MILMAEPVVAFIIGRLKNWSLSLTMNIEYVSEKLKEVLNAGGLETVVQGGPGLLLGLLGFGTILTEGLEAVGINGKLSNVKYLQQPLLIYLLAVFALKKPMPHPNVVVIDELAAGGVQKRIPDGPRDIGMTLIGGLVDVCITGT